MIRVKTKAGTVFEAMQFKTNNEAGSPQMDAVCNWANQGRGMKTRYHCWHDGTNVFVTHTEPPAYNIACADVGDWIVKARDSYDYYDAPLHVITAAGFAEGFEPVAEAAE